MKREKIKKEADELIKTTFDEEWLSKTTLTFDELRVLVNLIYSWRVTSKSTADEEKGTGMVIRSMEDLRKSIRIDRNKLYQILNDFETKYRYIDWERGKERKHGEEPKAAKFTIYFNEILSTPAPSKMIDLKTLLKSKKQIKTASINTNTITNINLNINAKGNADTIISPTIEISETTRLNKEEKKITMPNATSKSIEELNSKNHYLNAPNDLKEALDRGISVEDYMKLKEKNP